MPKIHPFPAVRPASHNVSHTISRTYQDYDTRDLEVQLDFNPYSFLQILNPGYRYNHDMKGIERFSMVRNRYLEFLEEQYLLRDAKPGMYIYQKTDREFTYTGIIAATANEDYKNNKIKKHEDTIASRENLFKEYLKTVGFNAEPVLLTYPDNDKLASLLSTHMKQQPLFDFCTTDKHRHKMWPVYDKAKIEQIQACFEAMDAVYIADGHHRSSSSYLLGQDMAGASYQHFMSFLIPESDLQIYEFNRLIKDLNGLSKEEFLIKLDQKFRIENRGRECYRPSKQHHFSMYLDGEFYSLYLRKTDYAFDNPLSTLDTHILSELVLKPILDIQDARTDNRIDFTYGKEDIHKMKDKIDAGQFEVGFHLFPATVHQMKAIADADQTMPPKSTYILPKLHSGMVIYEF